ncbi:MAG: PP2C family protein-serine/threonine phosphatase [Solirubrobacteraceae bacterium]
MGDDTWVVENAAVDPRAVANPLVAGELGLRFYAGAPLTTHDGYNLGTLCVIDREPRDFSAEQSEVLSELAEVVMDELELRLHAQRVVSQELRLREQAERKARELQASLLPSELPEVAGAERAALYLPADAAVVGGDFYDLFGVGGGWVLATGDVSGKDAAAAAVTGLARHVIRSSSQWASGPAEILENLNRTMLIDSSGDSIAGFCTVLLVFARRTERGFALRIASAGHSPALMIDPSGAHTEVGGIGPPAGWYEEAVFAETETELHAGQTLVMYTDGLTEARSEDGLLGIEPLVAALPKSAVSAAELIGALQSVIMAPGVCVNDDVAALAFRAI